MKSHKFISLLALVFATTLASAGTASAASALSNSEIPAPPPAPSAKSAADEAFAKLRAVTYERAPADLEKDKAAEWFLLHTERYRDLALKFYRDYPQDSRRWEAVEHYTLNMQSLGGRAYRQQARQLIEEALTTNDIAAKWWQKAKLLRIEDMMMLADNLQEYHVTVDLGRMRQEIDELTARFPEYSGLVPLELRYVVLLKKTDPGSAENWLVKLTQSKNKQVAQWAAGRARVLRMKEQPVEMKFTAVDGREVDLAKLRGRVVLIDFWATWCGPCVAELPNIQAVYAKYHEQGFEVVGISCDRPGDKEKFQKFVEERKMPWPQFLQEEKSGPFVNRFAEEYGIIEIPAPLLLNKEGKLISDNARGEKLEAEVKRLLEL